MTRGSAAWSAQRIGWLAFVLAAGRAVGAAVPYDIVYVRQPRFGANSNTIWPEVFHPARIDPGADLMLLHPDGGSPGRGRQWRGHGSLRLLRRAVGLLQLLPRCPAAGLQLAAR